MWLVLMAAFLLGRPWWPVAARDVAAGRVAIGLGGLGYAGAATLIIDAILMSKRGQ